MRNLEGWPAGHPFFSIFKRSKDHRQFKIRNLLGLGINNLKGKLSPYCLRHKSKDGSQPLQLQITGIIIFKDQRVQKR